MAFVIGLRKRCERPAEFPKRFPLTPRDAHAGARRSTHGNHLIFHRVRAEAVEILHLLHGAQDYEAILFPRD
ncbi:MAG: type II toxin-antitoxin system RelE/ParE family toxin [Methylocystis sp.]|uniref:type II toxin-antitoxin system RelE/ParE family toxin n=1 Tax=Methylocystis sp. TaxID=1911079 RepID=UPI003D09A5F2